MTAAPESRLDAKIERLAKAVAPDSKVGNVLNSLTRCGICDKLIREPKAPMTHGVCPGCWGVEPVASKSPKPCPACEGEAKINGWRNAEEYWVQCDDDECEATGPMRSTPEAALAAWAAMPRRTKTAAYNIPPPSGPVSF